MDELDRVRKLVDTDYKTRLADAAAQPGNAAAQAAALTSLVTILNDLRRIDALERRGAVAAPPRAPRVPPVGVPPLEIAFDKLPFTFDRFYFPESDERGTLSTAKKLMDELGVNKRLRLDGTGAGVIAFVNTFIDDYLAVLDVPAADDDVSVKSERTRAVLLLLAGDRDDVKGDEVAGGLADILRATAKWVGEKARANRAYERDADAMLAVLDWVLVKTTLGREYVASAATDTGRTQRHDRLKDNRLLQGFYELKGVKVPGVPGTNNQLVLAKTVPYTSLRFEEPVNNSLFLVGAYRALLGDAKYRDINALLAFVLDVLGIDGDENGKFIASSLEPGLIAIADSFVRFWSAGTTLETIAVELAGEIEKPVEIDLPKLEAKYLGVLVSTAFQELSAAHITPAYDDNVKKARFLYVAMLWFRPLQLEGEPSAEARSAFERIGARPRAAGAVIESAARAGRAASSSSSARVARTKSSLSTRTVRTAAAATPAARSVDAGVSLDFVRDSLLGWVKKQATLDADEGAGLKQFAETLYATLLASEPAALEKLVGADGLTLVVPSAETLRTLAERKAYVRTHVFKPARSFEELYQGPRLKLALAPDERAVRVTTRRSRFAQQRLVRIGDDPEQRVTAVIKLKNVRILVVDSWEPSASARAAESARMLLAGVRTGSTAALARAFAAPVAERVPAYELIEAYGEAVHTGASADVRSALAAELRARGESLAAIDADVRAALAASSVEQFASTLQPVAAPRSTTSDVRVNERAREATTERARKAATERGAAEEVRAREAKTERVREATLDRDAADARAREAADVRAREAKAERDAADARAREAKAVLERERERERHEAAGVRAREARAEADTRVRTVESRRAVNSDEANVARAVRASTAAAAASTTTGSDRNAVIASFNRVLNTAVDAITAADADGPMFDAVARVHEWYSANAERAGSALEPQAWASAIEALRSSLEEKGCVDESSTAWEHVEALATLHRLA